MQENKWGQEIPQSFKDEILSGDKLQKFCLDFALEQLPKEGYEIEGYSKTIPFQIKLSRYGKYYLALVIGELAPNTPKLSHHAKHSFVSFCKDKDFIPAFVEISVDTKENKNDVKYDGLKLLSDYDINRLSGEDLELYILEKLANAYKTSSFKDIFEYFDENIKYESAWALDPIISKDSLIAHYLKKEDIAKMNDDYKVEAWIAEALNKDNQKGLVLKQTVGNETNKAYVFVEFNEKHQITKIRKVMEDLVKYRLYYVL